MKKTPIKAVIFDLGGVVMHGGYLPFLKHFCNECFTKEGKKKIIQLEKEVNLGKISEVQFYRELQKTFHIHLTPRQIRDEVVKKMKTDKSLVSYIPKLKKAKTALFTNSIGHMAQEVLKNRKVPVHKLFDNVFVSSKIHMIKPDPKAYGYVLKKMKVKAKDALLVDDRLENVTPARKMGINGIVYKNATQFKKEFKKYSIN